MSHHELIGAPKHKTVEETMADLERQDARSRLDAVVQDRAELKQSVKKWFARENINTVDDLLDSLERSAEADALLEQKDLDALVEAAREAADAMVWILGGFDRVLSDEERDAALPRYHGIRQRLEKALVPYTVQTPDGG